MDENDALEALAGAQESANDSSNAETLDSINGLHEDLGDLNEQFNYYSEQMTEDMQNLFDVVSGHAEDSTEFYDETTEDLFDILDNIAGGVNGDKKEKIKAASGKITADKLKTIDEKYSLGGLLVYYKLEDLQKEVIKSINKITKLLGKSGKKGGGDDKKASKVKLDVDPKTIGEYGQALVQFAKGAIVMGLVPKKMAEAGLNLMITMISKLAESGDKLKDAQKNIGEIRTAMEHLVIAAVSLLKAAVFMVLATPFLILAIPALALMVLFSAGAGLAGKLAGDQIPNFQLMAQGFMFMGIAFMIGAFALAIMAFLVAPNLVPALIGLAAVTVFMILAIAVALLASLAVGSGVFLMMSVAFVLLGLGFILLSVALLVLEKIDLKAALKGMIAAVAVIAMSVVLAILCALGSLFFVFITLAGLLLFVGFTALLLAMGALWLIQQLFTVDSLTASLDIVFAVVMYLVDNLKTLLLGLVAGALLFVFGVLFLVATLCLLLSLLILGTFTKLDGVEVTTDGVRVEGIDVIVGICMSLADNILPFGIGLAAAAVLLPFAVLFLADVALIYEAVRLLAKMMEYNVKPEQAAVLGDQIRTIAFAVMLSIMGIKANAKGNIGVKEIATGVKNVAELTAGFAIITPFLLDMALVFNSMESIFHSFDEMSKIADKISPKTIEVTIGVLQTLLDAVGNVVSKSKDASAKTLKAVGELVKDVTEALNTIVDIVIRLKDGIPEEQIDAATTAIKQICEKLFGGPNTKKGEYTLTTLFETLAKGSLKKLSADACSAIKPLAEGIGAMAEVVINVSDQEKFSDEKIDAGSHAMLKVTELLGEIAKMCKAITEKLPLVGVSALEAVAKVASSSFFTDITTVMNGIGDMGVLIGGRTGDFDDYVAGIEKLGDTKFTKRITEFVNGLNALGNVKEKNVNKFVTSMNNLGNMSNKGFQSLKELTSIAMTADRFSLLSTGIGEIAEALNKLSKTKDSKEILKAIADANGSININYSNSDDKDKKQQNKGGKVQLTPQEQMYKDVGDILTIMTTCYLAGFPVKAKINSDTGEITPDNVGNDAGGKKK